ncbi:hypothetical protein [Peribacillus simplex]|uniref:hypothetical protein n=1 Tax=Peribacillus simplex TaxID=1478 RepID=UPI0021A9E03A|nr:hypothetical protein [Peribacillus simplex]
MEEGSIFAPKTLVEELRLVIDNLSRAIGDLADPFGDYLLDYIEEKLGNAHYLLFKNEKKIQFHQ